MPFADAGNAIRGHFAAAWGALTPVAWDNVTFDPQGVDEWVRFAIRDDPFAFAATTGPTPRHRHTGVAFVQVFVRTGTGPGRARQLADTAAAVFRADEVGGVWFRTPGIETVGPDGRGWYQVNVQAPFTFDSTFEEV